jgi:hypothetical protein
MGAKPARQLGLCAPTTKHRNLRTALSASTSEARKACCRSAGPARRQDEALSAEPMRGVGWPPHDGSYMTADLDGG